MEALGAQVLRYNETAVYWEVLIFYTIRFGYRNLVSDIRPDHEFTIRYSEFDKFMIRYSPNGQQKFLSWCSTGCIRFAFFPKRECKKESTYMARHLPELSTPVTTQSLCIITIQLSPQIHLFHMPHWRQNYIFQCFQNSNLIFQINSNK